jgi:peroxin-16
MLPVKTETELEKQETSKRARQFWWYLVRGPVLELARDRFESRSVLDAEERHAGKS